MDLNEIPFKDHTWSWHLLKSEKSILRLRSNRDPVVGSSGIKEDGLESLLIIPLSPNLSSCLGHAVVPRLLRWKDVMLGGGLTSTQRDHFELRASPYLLLFWVSSYAKYD